MGFDFFDLGTQDIKKEESRDENPVKEAEDARTCMLTHKQKKKKI